jgi:biotin transport system substrate-specific component
MTLTLATGQPVLADRIFSRKLVTDVVLVASGAAFVSLLAQLTIPLPYVPITGQTLAVLLVGASLGASRGALSLALYAALGLLGLPVYAPEDDGSHVTGLAAFQSNSFGYILGFILSAALVGWLAQRQWDRKYLGALAAFSIGTLAVFAVGLPWLATWLTINGADDVLWTTFWWGFVVFIPGGIIKAAIGAGLIRLAWFGVKTADERALAADADK